MNTCLLGAGALKVFPSASQFADPGEREISASPPDHACGSWHGGQLQRRTRPHRDTQNAARDHGVCGLPNSSHASRSSTTPSCCAGSTVGATRPRIADPTPVLVDQCKRWFRGGPSPPTRSSSRTSWHRMALYVSGMG